MRVAIVTTYAHKLLAARPELIEMIQNAGAQIAVMGPEPSELAAPTLVNHDISYRTISISRSQINPIREVAGTLCMAETFAELSVDCVLVYGVRMFPSVVLAARKAHVSRIVCVANGMGNLLVLPAIKGTVLRAFSFPALRYVLSKASAVVFQNPDDYAELMSRRIVSRYTNVVLCCGSGVNLNRFPASPVPHNQSFAMVTRLTPEKGVNEYVSAARLVHQRFPNSRFLLVGPRDDDRNLNFAAIETAQDEGFLEYLGESDNIANILHCCCAYVFPSYYREGVPRSVLEAMSTGRPIVTTTCPGCKETVVDGVNGFLVPPRDPNALADKLCWLLSHPDKAELMGNQSRKMAEDKFDVFDINNQILNALLPSNV